MASSTIDTDYAALVALLKEFHVFLEPKVTNGVPDYTPSAMRRQRRGLARYRRRLAAIDPAGWPVPEQVDYHLVGAQMNGLEFEHRVLRPWARDPAFYVTVSFQFGPKMHGAEPVPRPPIAADETDEFHVRLRAVPAILEQARENLTEGAADLALLGIRSKQREIGIFRNLVTGLREHHPALVADAKRALAAITKFRTWLRKSRKKMTAPAGIGVENYNLYLKNVHLVPYEWSEILTMAEREYERAVAAMRLEEHRNRRLPRLGPASGAVAITRKLGGAPKALWGFLCREDILTPPEYMKPKKRGPFPAHRGVRDYFLHILHRDPLPLMAHDIVGHTPDRIREARDKRPIRGAGIPYFISAFRAEGFATGIEEILTQTGLLDRRPRAKELACNLMAFRAARAISDLKMHSNELTLMQGFKHNVDMTPYGWLPKDSPTMWHDIELYMRQPGYGVSYLVGMVQLRQLMADRARELGGRFDLRRFMDAFLAAGMIPITLIRWEMTGLDDQIRRLW